MSSIFHITENAGEAAAGPSGLTPLETKNLLEETIPTGSGGTVTQGTSKSTGVTLSTKTGTITMHNANLAADAIVAFTLTNTLIAAADILLVEHVSAGTGGAYVLTAFPAAGSASVKVTNISAGTLGEAIVLRFTIIKSADA